MRSFTELDGWILTLEHHRAVSETRIDHAMRPEQQVGAAGAIQPDRKPF